MKYFLADIHPPGWLQEILRYASTKGISSLFDKSNLMIISMVITALPILGRFDLHQINVNVLAEILAIRNR
jgi:hypothetical protein